MRVVTILALMAFVASLAQAQKRPTTGLHAKESLSHRNDRFLFETDTAQMTALLELLDGVDELGDTHGSRLRQPDTALIGSLHAATLLPAHYGYAVRDPSRAWGTSSTVATLLHAFDQMRAWDRAAPRIRIHDLSLPHGGPMDGHKSHQTGRDVDLTYYRRNCPGVCTAQHVTPAELDAVRQWRLLRYWLERGEAEFIFIDYTLQRPLYEAARAAGTTAERLATWFQYPRGRASRVGIIRHEPNHANHVHVRFRCRIEDLTCKNTMRRVASDAERFDLATDESQLLELLTE